MRSYTSHGQTIDVELPLFGVFLWLAGGFVVRVQGRVFHPKLTHVGFSTSTEFDFDSDGRRISGVVQSIGRVRFPSRIQYAVIVDEVEVARDMQAFDHWPLAYFAWGVVLVSIGLAIVGLLHVFGLT